MGGVAVQWAHACYLPTRAAGRVGGAGGPRLTGRAAALWPPARGARHSPPLLPHPGAERPVAARQRLFALGARPHARLRVPAVPLLPAAERLPPDGPLLGRRAAGAAGHGAGLRPGLGRGGRGDVPPGAFSPRPCRGAGGRGHLPVLPPPPLPDLRAGQPLQRAGDGPGALGAGGAVGRGAARGRAAHRLGRSGGGCGATDPCGGQPAPGAIAGGHGPLGGLGRRRRVARADGRPWPWPRRWPWAWGWRPSSGCRPWPRRAWCAMGPRSPRPTCTGACTLPARWPGRRRPSTGWPTPPCR